MRRVGDVAILADTTNHRRVLDPLVVALCDRSGTSPRSGRAAAARRSHLRFTADAVDLARAVRAAARRGRVPVDSTEVLRRSLGAARALARARAFFEAPPAALVVASQAAPHVRAFLWEARRNGVPSVYVPHAPVARTRTYQDLPVDFAALRGDAEVEWYRQLGARDGLSVVGNPAIASLEQPQIDLDGPALLATSPQEAGRLRAVIEMAEAAATAVQADIVVAPHPRQDVAELNRLCPASWTIAPTGSTLELLRAGPWCVMQSSSGVAWEALALGLPTVELSPDGSPPAYPVITPPAVAITADHDAAIGALLDARRAACDPQRRGELTAHAHRWCATVGTRATEALVEVVDAAVKNGARRSQLLDAWWRVDATNGA